MDGINKLFKGFKIASSALRAERTRVDTIAKNIANAQTTYTPETGTAYRREVVHFQPILERMEGGGHEVTGVQVSSIEQDMNTPFEEVYDPGHPDADARGIVKFPNVNTMHEMADLITAVRAYEANINVQDTFERMAQRALRLGQ
tara:strand:+ start:8096 stop:8530 length:435 start_codon:yes stop_codon:yes gene_type:complete